ncbi:amidohydrolase family protein [Spirillospora sp. CA-255316]
MDSDSTHDRDGSGEHNEAGRRDFLRWLSLAGAGLAAGGALPLIPAAEARAAVRRGEVLVLTGATVIDGTGAPPRRDTTVVLVGDLIAWVGPRREVPVPAGARVVDARGRFVVPGLWDMHTHWTVLERIVPPLCLVNGVTGIREMWGYPEVRAVRDRIDGGELLGPRIVMASTIIDGPVTLLGPPAALVGTAAEARAAVRQAKEDGSDFIKIYSYLSRECLEAVADEARRVGLPFAGHHVYRMPVGEVSDAGMRSFEHLHGIPVPLSSREAEFREIMDRTPMDPADPRAFFKTMRELERQAAATYSPDKAAKMFARWVRNGSWQSPTLTVNRVMSSPAGTYADDPRLKYMPRDVRPSWASAVRVYAPATPEEIAQQREFLRFRLELVGAMHRAGVGILAGTDCGNPYCFPGSGLHDELELLVESGLTPMQALRTVTRDAARFLGRESTMGTVTRGKVADLVLLDADPLADIRNIRRIDSVVTKGRLITREQRARMLADVEAAAEEPATRTLRSPALPACGCLPAG